MAPISVRLLGGLDVDGVDPRTVGSRKARRLLELLALGRGRTVPFDVLVEELWPERPPARPIDQLAVLVSRLRARLGADTIERRDAGYRLHYGRLDLDDLSALTDEVQRRQAGAPVAVRALTRLALVADPGGMPTGRTTWAIDRSAEVSRLVARAVHAGMTALATAEQWPAAADAAARAVELDPFDEAATTIRMTALAATGRSGAALTEYHRFRRRLAEELGVDPAVETQRLYSRILRDRSAAPAAKRSAPRGALVGRRRELAALDGARRSAGRSRVLVLEGEAGIGKTSLLTTWTDARRTAGGTVLFGTCRPHDEAVPLDVVIVAVADHLARSGGATNGPQSRLISTLAGRSPATRAPGQVEPGVLLADGAPDPGLLFGALVGVLGESAPLVLVLDDAYLGGPLLASFVDFVARRPLDLCLVLAVRPGEGQQFPGHQRLVLGPLDRAATAELVGADRADLLFDRTLGHPLLLAELARETDVDVLPAGLVESVTRRCASLGPAAPTLRAAAVLGGNPDPELLSGVLGRPVMDVLADLELAQDRYLVVADGPSLAFRHELVRQAVVAGVLGVVASGWHRAAARILARRPDVDPMTVAGHARDGNDRELAADWLGRAAGRAAERFDHATARALLDDAVRIRPSPALLLERARLNTLTGRYRAALADLDASGDPGPAALEVRAWAAYFGREFRAAREAADDGTELADDPAVRTRCLMIGGRIRHAGGDLAGAEALLGRAARVATGTDRVTARAWLGILRAHQSRTDDALALLRPSLRTAGASDRPAAPGVGPTAATLHSLLFGGHAHALAGRPAAALRLFDAYTAEVDRRQVTRFAGRGTNFGGWVLRNVGAVEAGVDAHLRALETGDGQGTAELRIAATLDLAEAAIVAGDPDLASTRLERAAAEFGGDLVFGWRLEFKARLLRGRLALLAGDPGAARQEADRLAAAAHALGIPRYASVARLLGHRAAIALREPLDPAAVSRDLDLADASVALESWWWAGELGAVGGERRWLTRAQAGAARLLVQAGAHEETFRRHVDRLVDGWLTGRPAPPAG
ncbi:MAG TPA: BTAD domain-containing putative transcriptional regulator [Nakamurella sp.]